MQSLEKISEKIKNIKLAKIPLGEAILILLGLGVSDALIPATTRFVRSPIISGGLVAFLAKMPIVERFLGSTFANVLAATAAATGIEDQIALRGRTHAMVSGLVGRVAPMAGIVAPRATANMGSPAPAPVTTASLGQVDVSEQERRILSSLKGKA